MHFVRRLTLEQGIELLMVVLGLCLIWEGLTYQEPQLYQPSRKTQSSPYR